MLPNQMWITPAVLKVDGYPHESVGRGVPGVTLNVSAI